MFFAYLCVQNIPPVITNLPNAAFLSEDTTVKTEVFKIEVTETDTFVCEADKVLPVTANTAFVVEKKTGGPGTCLLSNRLITKVTLF